MPYGLTYRLVHTRYQSAFYATFFRANWNGLALRLHRHREILFLRRCEVEERSMQLIEILHAGSPIPATELAERLGVSTRTIRAIASEINRRLVRTLRVVNRRGKGYGIEILDESSFKSLLGDYESAQRTQLPSTPEERQAYLLADLVSRTDWITQDELCDVLFVFKRTLSNDLKEVKGALGRFGLTLESKPYHGIKVIGNEGPRRICLASTATGSVVGKSVTIDVETSGITSLVGIVTSCVDTATTEQSFKVDALTYHNLIVHIAIAVARIQAAQYIPMQDDQLSRIEASPEFDVARDICKRIEGRLSVRLPRAEIAYIALHLAGKRSTFDAASSGSPIITDTAWNIVTRMLEYVFLMFKFDLRDDIELHMNLARHIMPLSVRLRNHMNAQNPLLDDIRKRFPPVVGHGLCLLQGDPDT